MDRMIELTLEERKQKIKALLQDDSLVDLLQNYITLSIESKVLNDNMAARIHHSDNEALINVSSEIETLLYSQLYKLRNLILRKCGIQIELFEEIWEDKEGIALYEIYMSKMIEEDVYPHGIINKSYIKLLVASLVNIEFYRV
ncbi:hypothetical protein [Bacillus suaedaesalsae]|uniref:Uncharacterized protein n=1 Tax=Bacillus suaedaesalsae TaxID=2810349 RepID=A0ABS2DEF8_9BACI|nr:hypothetical protein [Bacillus suaedaesalsae]MBM6616829.1 hypothetical protein [Bacillus suaedaesalsae]